ncbi:Gfo/Idh/MocA family protein [Salsipaludibacter albus]|uniref:Gfo/Idh/MocA family protein n=1 Tax=Salsipaludibacter albus TaxID=2849650 RepID=UPI001EE4255F|nr:Gfo/Idh/MocA family oxidoreductase [Salsipaludibacter albus]
MQTAPAPTPDPPDAPPTPVRGYRAGIVGGGFMGGVHAHAVRVLGGTVTAVASSTPASAARAATALHATRAADDLDELLAMDDVDVVHVCTPNHLHHPVALAALEAGKHVVCEKPLATSSALAAELVTTADRAGLVATVPFVYRFHAMVREARDRVRRGDVGRVLLAHGSYLQDWLADPAEDNWRVDAELGGASRAFADIGSHWCDLLEFVTGDRIATLSAQLVTAHPRRGSDDHEVDTEDIATISFTTRGGVPGSAVISQVSPGRKNRLLLEVSGSDGSLAFDQERSELLWHGRRDASRSLVRDPDVLSAAAVPYSRLPGGHPMGYQDCFDAFVADTAAAIAGGQPDGLPTFADGLRSTRVVEAVVAAADSGTWVEVPA